MDDGKIRIMFSGRLGVEFFFLVSGYLMAAAIAKIIERGENFSVSRESEKFLLKNFCRYIRWLWFHFASTSYSLVVSKNNLFWG